MKLKDYRCDVCGAADRRQCRRSWHLRRRERFPGHNSISVGLHWLIHFLRWCCVHADDGVLPDPVKLFGQARLHVMPNYGVRPHASTDDCWCLPRRDQVDASIAIHREVN